MARSDLLASKTTVCVKVSTIPVLSPSITSYRLQGAKITRKAVTDRITRATQNGSFKFLINTSTSVINIIFSGDSLRLKFKEEGQGQ